MKKLLFATAIALALSFAARAQSNQFDFSKRLGIAEINAQHQVCLSITNAELRPGGKVTLVTTGGKSRTGQATVEKKLTTPCNASVGAEDGTSNYLLKLAKGSLRFGVKGSFLLPGIAVTDFDGPVNTVRGMPAADLNHDGKVEYFRECTSSEGVHYTVWRGRPLGGKRVWTSYYYLGYDVVPNCNPKDYEEK